MQDLFDEWADLNDVMSSWRSRFDVLREEFPNCRTKQDAQRLLSAESYSERFPLLPSWLPDERER